MHEGGMVRTFVAIELPDAVRAALLRVQTALSATRLPIRPVRPEGIHLTLAFLGEIPAGRVPAVRAAVQQSAAGIPVFTLRAEGVGMFPHARRPRVVWVGVEAEPEARAHLETIQRRLVAALQAARFECDARFDPHLTLGRVQDYATAEQAAQIGAAVQALPRLAPVAFDVAHISIMRSDLRPGGAVYTRLDAIPLLPEAAAP